MSDLGGSSADGAVPGQVGLDITYEKLSRSRISLSVWYDGKLRHKDILNLSIASAREKFAKTISAKLKVKNSAVEARLLLAAEELEVQGKDATDQPDDDRAMIANITAAGRGLSIDEIAGDLRTLTDGWPKRVGDRLFVEAPGHRVRDLNSPAKLFSWIDANARVVWGKGDDRITQERFFEHLRVAVESYEAVESLPHWPPLPGVYYMHPELPESEGNFLDRLLRFFRPATPEDRSLLKALWATPAWGGKPGSQPAFLITGPDEDLAEMGRGVGKSTLTELVGLLYGGFVDVSPHADIDKIKTRLLSRGARQKRIARLDNVKSHRFSWGDLENLITTPVISGHDMYEGEGQRLNTLTWLITLNGASLSKDLAQRVVIIKLARPEYSKDWGCEIRTFIEEHRWEVLRDIQGFLEGPAREGFLSKTRWAEWEEGVLARGKIPLRCRTAILLRQQMADADASERDLVAAEFREELTARGHDPNADRVFIPSKVAAEWLSAATRIRYETNKATVHLKMLGIAELIPGKKTSGLLGWEWRGVEAPVSASRRKVRDRPGGAPAAAMQHRERFR